MLIAFPRCNASLTVYLEPPQASTALHTPPHPSTPLHTPPHPSTPLHTPPQLTKALHSPPQPPTRVFLAVDVALSLTFAGFISLPFFLLNNLQRSLENPFAGEDETDADPDDIRLDELQLMTYMKEDAANAMRLQAEIHRRMSATPAPMVCPLPLSKALPCRRST